MKQDEAEKVLARMGFDVAVNEFGRWVGVKGDRKVFGDSPLDLLNTVRADYRPGREN